jgi:Tfp pilus assembly protein PilO
MKLVYRKYIKTAATIWAVCFGLLALAYMFVLVPQKKSLTRIRQQLAVGKQEYESAQQAAHEEYQFKQREEIERLESKLRDFVVGREGSDNITFDISQIAKQKKVDNFSVKHLDKSKRGASDKLDCDFITESYISVSFTGEFDQFAKLLNALERHRPAIFVDEFSIARSRKEGAAHDVNMEMAIFVKKRTGEKVPPSL